MSDQSKFLSNIINNHFAEVVIGKTKSVHFHTLDRNTFCSLVDDALSNIKGDFEVLKFQITKSDIKEPYQPFLNLLRNFVNAHGINIPELIETANVYPIHRPLFESYLSNKLPDRKEELILDQLSYEMDKIRESILRLISEISQQLPLIIAVANIHYADHETLLLIQSIKKTLTKSRVLFLFSYNKNYQFSDEDRNDNWSNFTNYSEENYSIFDLAKKNLPTSYIWPRSEVPNTINEILNIGLLNLNFFTFEEAIKCASKAHDLLKGEVSVNDRYSNFTALSIIGNSYYYMGENDNAIAYYRMLLEEAHKQNNPLMLSEAYRKLGLSHIKKFDIEAATKLAHQSLKFANIVNDDYQFIKVYLLLFLIADKETQPMDRDTYFKLLNLLKKYKLESTYDFCLQNSYVYINYYNGIDEIHEQCDKGIEISKKNQNEYALAINYHKKGITYSFTENYDLAIQYYQKSKALRLKLGNPLHIIRIYNGIGFIYMVTEDYKNAHRYLTKSISIFNNIRDYNEVSATLFNFALLHYLGRDYKGCIKVIDKLLLIMKIFNITYLPYRTIADVYILKALCHFKIGDHFKSIELINRVNSTPSNKLSEEYQLMLNMLEGLNFAANHQDNSAVQSFEKALREFEPNNKAKNILLPSYYLEYGLMLHSIGRKEHAALVFKKGLDYCSTISSVFYKKLFQNALEGNPNSKLVYKFPNVKLDLEAIVEIAKQQVTLNKLHKKIREIEFLNKLQELSSAYSTKQAIAESYLDLIHVNFPAEVALLHTYEDGKLCCLASKHVIHAEMDNTISYLEELCSKEEPLLLDFAHDEVKIGDLNEKFSSVINIPVKNDKDLLVNLFLATIKSQNYFSNDDLNVLTISTKQVATMFTKIDQDLALLKMTRTDILTGLNNRQALQAKFNLEMLKIKNNKNTEKIDLSIMFIDLDNFKFYNDTFGHKIGDLIIKSFAEVLKKEFTGENFISRFGGDEFVAVLPNTDENKSKIYADKLVTEIFSTDYFKNVLEDALGYPVNMPENKTLTCSIGIAGYKFTEHKDNNLDILLHNADLALYKAKSSGKNTVRIY